MKARKCKLLTDQDIGRLVETGADYEIRGALVGYIEYGVSPGGFLLAVLRNNLRESIVFADGSDLTCFVPLVRWICNYAPSQCWGSEAKVNAWVIAKGQR